MSVSTDKAWFTLRAARAALDRELTAQVGNFIEEQQVEERNPDGRSNAELHRHLVGRRDALAESARGLLDRMRAEIKKQVDPEVEFGRTYFSSDTPAEIAREAMAVTTLSSALARGIEPADAARGVIQAYAAPGWRAARQFFTVSLSDWSESDRTAFGRMLDELVAGHPDAPEPMRESLRLQDARDALLTALDRRAEWVERAVAGTSSSRDLLELGIGEEMKLAALDEPVAAGER